jgi:starvation-inducible DNA-binding protein
MTDSHSEAINQKNQVDFQPNIGLGKDDRHAVVTILNEILPIETGLTIRTRIAHWNLRGSGYSEQRIMLASQCEQLNQITEKLAERIKMLGELAIDLLQEFLHEFKMDDLFIDPPNIQDLLTAHEKIIRKIRVEAKKCSDELGDEVTRQFLLEILFQHEKMAWTLRSFFYFQQNLREDQAGIVK